MAEFPSPALAMALVAALPCCLVRWQSRTWKCQGGFVALAPILKSPPASVPRAWLVVGGRQFQALWVYDAASGWRTGDICVDAQVKQPVLHSTNRLFLLLFQLAVTRDTSEDAGDLHLGQLLPPSKAKGTIRRELLRYF